MTWILPLLLAEDGSSLVTRTGSGEPNLFPRNQSPDEGLCRNTLSNCVGGVMGCVRGCSPAFIGGWQLSERGALDSSERR